MFSISFDASDKISIEHFRIERVLGSGGFGVVNAVTKISEPYKNKWFALKTIKKQKLLESHNWTKLRSNIFSEMIILSVIKHPFICNAYCKINIH